MLQELMSNLTLVSILALVNSFLLVYYVIPKIAWVIKERKLTDTPNGRSSHQKAIPTMAGVSFFIALILMMFFIQYFDTERIGLNFIAASTLIFMVGVKDDLVVSTPRVKITLETLAVFFLLFHTSMHDISLHGFLGIYEIPHLLAYVGSILLALTIINAFNLIDGIDGLAATIGIVIFSIFGLIFYVLHLYFYFLMCLSLIGMLLAYLVYNFSTEKKIFMGDTGSLLIGFCIAFFTLKFISIDVVSYTYFKFKLENELIIVAAILCIPIFDMFRVIGVRLLKGKSPFFPDRNHIHHILIDSGMSHFNASMLLGFINYAIVILLIWLSSIFNSVIMMLILAMLFGLFLVVFDVLRNRLKGKQ